MPLKKRKQTVPVLIAIFMLLAIAIALTVLNVRERNELLSSSVRRLDIPTVNTRLVASDGEAHNVQTRFTVEVDMELGDAVTAGDMHTYLDAIMTTLDYERMLQRDSIDYITAEVMDGLTAYMDTETLKRVYITDIDTGDTLPQLQDNGEAERVNSIFKGLFPNVE